MRDGRLHIDDVELRRLDPLAPPLSQVEGRRLSTGQKEGDLSVAHGGAGAHLDPGSPHGSEMALFVFQIERAGAAMDQVRLQVREALDRGGFLFRPRAVAFFSPRRIEFRASTAWGSFRITPPRGPCIRRVSGRIVVQSPGAPPPILSAGSTNRTGPDKREETIASSALSSFHSAGRPAA